MSAPAEGRPAGPGRGARLLAALRRVGWAAAVGTATGAALLVWSARRADRLGFAVACACLVLDAALLRRRGVQ